MCLWDIIDTASEQKYGDGEGERLRLTSPVSKDVKGPHPRVSRGVMAERASGTSRPALVDTATPRVLPYHYRLLRKGLH